MLEEDPKTNVWLGIEGLKEKQQLVIDPNDVLQGRNDVLPRRMPLALIHW
jgi:hypothetical protein